MNLQSDFVTAKKCINVTIYFFDRTNVRSKLLLLGHLPNLVGHCPMSDSNLQPCSYKKSERSVESRTFSPGAPVSSHRES